MNHLSRFCHQNNLIKIYPRIMSLLKKGYWGEPISEEIYNEVKENVIKGVDDAWKLLEYGFSWSETLEGRSYWSNIDSAWQKYCRNNKLNRVCLREKCDKKI